MNFRSPAISCGSRLIISASVSGLLALAAVPEAAAQTTFTNGAADNAWSTAANWTAGEPTAALDAILPSPIPGSGTITLASGELANQLFFQNSYTLTGGALTLTTGDITVDPAFTATINSTLSGTTGLTKLGTGTLVLGGTNTLTGNFEVNEGTVRFSSLANINSVTALPTFLGTATTVATLDYTGATTSTSRSIALGSLAGSATGNIINIATAGQTFTITGSITGGPAAGNTGLTVTGAGVLSLNNGTPANNTFLGNIVVDGGGLQVVGSNGITSDPLQLGAGSKTITLQNGGRFISATTLVNPTSTNSKNFVIGTGGGTINTGSQILLDDAGQFSGTGTLTKLGTGTLTLGSQAFAFTGAVNLDAGTLIATANGGVLGNAAANAPVTVGSGAAVFDVQIGLASTRSVTISGTGISSSGALINSSTTATGAVNGTVFLAGNASFGGNGLLTVPTLDGGGVTRSLTKVGTGTFVVSGAGTNFSGTTAVAVTGGEVFLNNATAFGPAAALTASGTASGVVQNGAANAAYSYTVGATGLIGGNKLFLDSLAVGTNLNALPETLVETAADVLETTTLAIPNDASRFFGIAATLSETVTIGTGTPWKGISNDNAARAWQTGTITANSNFEIRNTNGKPLTIGNTATAGSVTIATAGPINATVTGGNLLLDDNTPGFTGNLTFVVSSGASLQTVQSNSLGASATAADNAMVNVLSGGTLNPNAGSSLSGNVTIQPGGILNLDDATNITGIGTITQSAGSITRIANATALNGAQSPGTVAGSIVRLDTTNIGLLTSKINNAANFVVVGGNRTLANSTTDASNALTLNSAGGVTGILTNDGSSRSLTNETTSIPAAIAIGAGGGTFVATNATTLTLGRTDNTVTGGLLINGAGNALNIGVASPVTIDGQAKGAGTGVVVFVGNGTTALNAGAVNVLSGGFTLSGGGATYTVGVGTGDTTVSTGTTFTVNTGVLVGSNVANAGGAVRFNGSGTTSPTSTVAGSISGTGSLFIGQASGTGTTSLTVGSNNLSTTYSGVIQNGSATWTGSLTKVGTGMLTLSGTNTYTGLTTVSEGILKNDGSIAGATTVASNATLMGTGQFAAVTIQSGGTLSPGSSPETLDMTSLNLAGNLLLEIGAAVQNLGNLPPNALVAAATGAGTTGNGNTAANSGYGTSYDHINVAGALALAVTGTVTVDLLAGYSPRAGDIFNLMDATTLDANNAANFTTGPRFRYGTAAENALYDLDFTGAAGTLTGFGELGLAFDTSLFLSEGLLVVVPEPSRALLLLAGAALLTGRRRSRTRGGNRP